MSIGLMLFAKYSGTLIQAAEKDKMVKRAEDCPRKGG